MSEGNSGYFAPYNSRGIFTIYETDDRDPFGDDRLRLYWDHPLFPGQRSLRFCSAPISPDDDPAASCLAHGDHSWPRQALARRFNLDPEALARIPAERLFRTGPEALARGEFGEEQGDRAG